MVQSGVSLSSGVSSLAWLVLAVMLCLFACLLDLGGVLSGTASIASTSLTTTWVGLSGRVDGLSPADHSFFYKEDRKAQVVKLGVSQSAGLGSRSLRSHQPMHGPVYVV